MVYNPIEETDLCWCHRCAIFLVLAELTFNCAPAFCMLMQLRFGGSKCFVRAKSLARAPSTDTRTLSPTYPVMRIADVSVTNIPISIFFALFISQILRVRSFSAFIFDVLQFLCRILSIATLQYRDERLTFRRDSVYIRLPQR